MVGHKSHNVILEYFNTKVPHLIQEQFKTRTTCVVEHSRPYFIYHATVLLC